MRWLACALLTASLASAVFLKGGVYPQQWEWSALGVSVAAILSLMAARPSERPTDDRGLAALGLLWGWMALQLVPFPPALVAWLSPDRWSAAAAARAATGQGADTWLALSVAPAATMQRLLDVTPAMAAFVAAREMGWWWRDRPWIAVAPIVGVAWLQSLLGLAQFYILRMAGGEAGAANGTYVNHNHFAGLLEMAFPLALFWAVTTWKIGMTRFNQPLAPALRASLLLGVAVCLLAGVVVSLSRMGFVSILVASGITGFLALRTTLRRYKIRWLAPIAVPLTILLFLPTRELAGRFASITAAQEITKDVRIDIWKDSVKLVAAYKWTGCGLGAYERGLYRYKTAAPANTVDFAHNDYLQILGELGVPGGVLAMGIALWILGRILRVVLGNRGSENWALAAGLLGSMLALGLHSMADFNLYIPANALALAWLGGVGVSLKCDAG